MIRVIHCVAAILFIFITFSAFGQVAMRTGSIYGKVVDDKGAPLPGVLVTLESTLIPAQTAHTGGAGSFRFANLPPGNYSVNFSIEGFTEVRQEEVRVSTGSQVALDITMRAALAEEFTVIGETPVVDTKKTGTSDTFSREYLEDVPSARDHGQSLIKQLALIPIGTTLRVLNPDSKQLFWRVVEVMIKPSGTTMV